MFEAKGPSDFTTRAHITAVDRDRHLSPSAGHVYFYDPDGLVAFSFAAQELHYLTSDTPVGTSRTAPISHRLGNQFGYTTNRKYFSQNINRFELNNPYVQTGLNDALAQEYKKWATLQVNPECTVQFLQLTKRGETESALMCFNQLPFIFSLNQLFVLQGISYGYTETELSKIFGRESSAGLYSILHKAVDRNGYMIGDRAAAIDEMVESLEPLNVLTTAGLDLIEQRIYDLHREVQTLPAHMSST